MQFIILILHVLVCASLIGLVLMQHGKGADIGAAFGAGASQTVFGSTGASSFLMKLTGGLAALFFATSIFLGHMDAESIKQSAQRLPINNTNSIVIPGERTTSTVTKPKTTVPANTEKK